MKLLKTISITILLICFTINVQAQQKKTYPQKRAADYTEFISSEMNMNADQETYLHEVLLNKFETNSKRNKDNNLSQEEKKQLYKQSFKETSTKLSEQFSKEEVDQINELIKTKNKASKK